MVPGVGRIPNARIVASGVVPKDTTMDDLAIRRGLGTRDACPIYFDADITVERATFREPAVTGPEVEYRH